MNKVIHFPTSRIKTLSKLLQFFSLAALTQVTLVISQLVMLPIQIHRWGDSATALWYQAIAIANITTIADFGLRMAGHAELFRSQRECPGDTVSAEQFQQVWAWIRVLILGASAALILGAALYSTVFKHEAYPLWKHALVLAFALETVLIVRIMYLDSLGFYRVSEATYLIFAALRLVLSICGIMVFDLRSNGLGWLFLISSAGAVLWQDYVCHQAKVLRLFDRPAGKLSFRVLTLARHTLAEPCANWVRLSLPVLVIAALASPIAVTAYVALRAVFGAARSTIQQVARVGSVEYMRVRAAGQTDMAESLLGLFILLSVALGAGFGGGVVLENLRLLRLWLRHCDRATFQIICASFAVSAPFYAYQVRLSLMFRVGRLRHVAGRLYAFILLSALFAGAALAVGSFHIYLILLPLAEFLLGASFMRLTVDEYERSSTGGQRAFATACAGSLLMLALCGAVRWGPANIFSDISPSAAGWTSLYVLIAMGLLAGFAFVWDADLWRTILLVAGRSQALASSTPAVLAAAE